MQVAFLLVDSFTVHTQIRQGISALLRKQCLLTWSRGLFSNSFWVVEDIDFKVIKS